MLAAASRAFAQIVSPPFRTALLKSLGLTLVMLAAVWAALYWTVTHFVATAWPALDVAIDVITGIGLFVGLGFLIAPVTSLFAGLFLDEIAAEVERLHYPLDPPGRDMPIGLGILQALRFTGLVIVVNILVLMLILLPGINITAFFVANAYLLGREYFEQIAARFHDPQTVAALRSAASGRIFLAGLVIALVLAIPIVNLLTPLFATAFMVHIYKEIEVRQAALTG
jgi:CysZ protein